MKTLIKKIELKRVEANQIHRTKNYSIFNTIESNRGQGKSDGIEKNRLKFFNNIMKSVMWLPAFGLIYINRDGYVLDGNHKLSALKKRNDYILFVVLDEEFVNPTTKILSEYRKQLMISMSKMNQKDSAWRTGSHFRGALELDFELAVLINEQIQYVSANTTLSDKDVPANHIYSLVKTNTKHFGSAKKILIEDYLNVNDISYIKTNKFALDMEFYIVVAELVRKLFSGASINKALKIIFNGFWMVDKVGYFNADRFISCLKNSTFSSNSDRVDDLKILITDIYNYRYVKGKRVKNDVIFKINKKRV